VVATYFKIQDVPLNVSLSTVALNYKNSGDYSPAFWNLESQVLYQGSSCGIYGGRSSNVTVFAYSILILLCQSSFHQLPVFTFVHMPQTLYNTRTESVAK